MIAAYNSVLFNKSQSFSIGHLFHEMYDAAKRWPSEKFKENFETYVSKVHCYAAIIIIKYLC